MGKQPQPRNNPVVDSLEGLILSAGALPLAGAISVGGAAPFWVFLAVGVIYFGLLFWMAVRKRKTMLPGLIIGAALSALLSSACYQFVNP